LFLSNFTRFLRISPVFVEFHTFLSNFIRFSRISRRQRRFIVRFSRISSVFGEFRLFFTNITALTTYFTKKPCRKNRAIVKSYLWKNEFAVENTFLPVKWKGHFLNGRKSNHHRKRFAPWKLRFYYLRIANFTSNLIYF